MAGQGVSALTAEDRGAAIGTVVDAFAADPVEQWLYPDDQDYARHFPAFAEAFGGRSFEHGTAWGIEGGAAVALWFGPGIEPDEEAVGGVLAETVAPAKHEELFEVLGQMGAAHVEGPHWYLPLLAVEPARQGEGLGGRPSCPPLASMLRA
jgi:hypothetical protein